MAEPQVHYLQFPIHIRVMASTLRGEQWYTAEGYMPDWGDFAYGRTPERAVSFLLEKYAKHLREGRVNFGGEKPFNDPGISCEIQELAP